MGQLVNSILAVRDFFDGKKQMLASLAAAIPATGLILANIKSQGTPYLAQVAHTPEFATASIAWIGFFNAMKGEKIRQAIAQLPAETAQSIEETTDGTSKPDAQAKT